MGDGKRPGADIRLLRMRQAADVVRQTMRQHGIRRVQGDIKTPGGSKRNLMNMLKPRVARRIGQQLLYSCKRYLRH